MKRTAINNMGWSEQFAFNQAELVEGVTTYLHFSGQTALEDDPNSEMGVSVVGPDDMRKQVEFSLASIDSLLSEAGMDRSNILTIRVFTTDVDRYLENYDVFAAWVSEAGIKPPQTLLGVSSLAIPGLMVEIEATAGA